MVLNRYQLVLNAQSFIYIYIYGSECTVYGFHCILSLCIEWVIAFVYSVLCFWFWIWIWCLKCSFFLYLMEILNILLFSELFVCFLRYWGRKRCWIYWIFLNLGLNVKLCCYLKWIGFFSWKLKHHIWTNIYIFKQKGPKLNHLQFNFISKQTNPTMPYRVLHV